jgi:phosphotransferase system  glucose/maltose/N-acetylglucosamine-specific IIC component
MRVHFDISALKTTKWHEYALRFLFGGAITVVTGVLAAHCGPVFGGLFLAFPAIFPASATLVEKHEREKKRRAGIAKTSRGREAAALDARGAAIGSIGLIGFAVIAWRLTPHWNRALALLAALVVWMILSILIWLLRRHHLVRKGRASAAPHASLSSKG